ncbi:unnamed protein product, partial [Hapterophycus canaliculatus]
RSRALHAEAARGGGGGGGVSPRILSQPSSPCFSATSHSSSACTSPGRSGRAGGGRHGHGGVSGFSLAHASGGGGGGAPPGFLGDGGMMMDPEGALHTTLSLRLNGDGGRVGAVGDGDDGGFWAAGGSGGSGFATAPAGGSIAMGFPSSGGGGGGSLHESSSGRGVIGGGSRSNGASPSMHAMIAPKTLGGSRLQSRLVGATYYDELSGDGGGGSGRGMGNSGGGASHGASLSRPGSAGPTGRSSSLSMLQRGGEDVLSSSFHGLSSGSMAGAMRTGAARKSSYDDRGMTASWLDGPHGRAGDSGGGSTARPTDLRISHSAHFDQSSYGEGGGGRGGGAGGDGARDAATWRAMGGGNGASATEDLTEASALMCAEFALLTPKRALEQHQQALQQRQQPPGATSPTDMWSSTGGWAAQGAAGDVGGVGSGRLTTGPRGGSDVGSPEGTRASRAGGAAGDDVDESCASSGGSGGGERQGSVRAAFGATLDSAAGPGGGGGGEASVAGGALDASFCVRADGDDARRVNGSGGGTSSNASSAAGNGSGNGGVEAQRYDDPDLPLMMKAGSSFFGEDDLSGVALEDTDGAASSSSLSSSMPSDLNSLLDQHHGHRHTGGVGSGAFSTGASPSRGGGGGGGGGGVIGRSSPSPGPLDGSSLAAALQDQLSLR